MTVFRSTWKTGVIFQTYNGQMCLFTYNRNMKYAMNTSKKIMLYRWKNFHKQQLCYDIKIENWLKLWLMMLLVWPSFLSLWWLLVSSSGGANCQTGSVFVALIGWCCVSDLCLVAISSWCLDLTAVYLIPPWWSLFREKCFSTMVWYPLPTHVALKWPSQDDHLRTTVWHVSPLLHEVLLEDPLNKCFNNFLWFYFTRQTTF